MKKSLLHIFLFTCLIAPIAWGQWTEPELFPVEHGNAIRGPWISNDNLRMYAAFSGYIFVAERVHADSAWTPFHNVNNHINGASRQESPCESPTGDTLYFMAEGREPCYGSYDIYYTIRTDTGWWGPIYNCGPNINSQWMEWTVGISRDGSKLLVSSNRIPGGVLYLYYSDKQPDGTWDSLISFGPNINSFARYGESTHGSLSANGTQLVFSGLRARNGDIHLSRFENGSWSIADYIPEPVTTQQWREWDPCFGPDGRTLYFISDRDAHHYGGQLYVTTDTTTNSAGPTTQPLPAVVEPALFSRIEGQTLVLTLIGSSYRGQAVVKVFDVLGRLVQKSEVVLQSENGTIRSGLTVNHLPSGAYIAEIEFQQTVVSAKFVTVK